MLKVTFPVFSRVLISVVVVGAYLSSPSSAHAQYGFGQFGFGMDGGADSETSRAPFRLVLHGVLNPTTPNPERMALVPLTVGTYREVYQFEVRTADIPDYTQASPRQVLRNLTKYVVQMHLAGTKELLSKVGQAYPGTPITVEGLFTPRSRQFVILSVDVFSLDGHAGE